MLKASTRMGLSSTLLVVPSVAASQPQGSAFDLGTPSGRIERAFSRITGAAELADGRLVITDPTEVAVYVLDFAKRSASQLGRAGDGPNEYQRPFGVLRAPGDTLVVASSGGVFLRVDPSGTLAGSVRYVLRAGSGGMSIPRGIDSHGRLYWSSDFVILDPQRRFRRNQRPTIKSWAPGDDSARVVATYADHAVAMTAHRFHPYAELDAWVVAPDGRVGVLVAADYHLRWIKDGRTTSEGKPIPFVPVPIGNAERAAYREAQALKPASGAQFIGPTTGTERREAARRSMTVVYPDAMFPQTLPPFEENGAWLSPRGDVFVARSRAAMDSVPVIDILDQTGARRGSLRLPQGRRLLALDRNGIYLVHTDSDGLQWVERYAWTAALR